MNVCQRNNNICHIKLEKLFPIYLIQTCLKLNKRRFAPNVNKYGIISTSN